MWFHQEEVDFWRAIAARELSSRGLDITPEAEELLLDILRRGMNQVLETFQEVDAIPDPTLRQARLDGLTQWGRGRARKLSSRESDEYELLNAMSEAARANLEHFVAVAAYEAKLDGLNAVHGRNFAAALRRLCPIWPFC